MATHPGGPHALAVTNQYIRWGASPRGAQALSLAAKVYAMLDGRYNASFSDVQRAAGPGLRHRVLLNFEGEAEGAGGGARDERRLSPAEVEPGSGDHLRSETRSD